jgi:UDP-2,3-diacylglucosamine pyrophosphatase LpxH
MPRPLALPFASDESPAPHNNYYRSIWISDLHLGTRACKAEALLGFLRHHQADNLYLVGDIVDCWNLGGSWFWSEAQECVVREITMWRRQGTRVVFLPGNHDEFNTDLVQMLLGPILTQAALVHRTAEGRRMLVTHGHQFDSSLSSMRWLSMMGGSAYTMALRINEWYVRERFRTRKASVSAYLKRRATKAVRYLTATGLDDRAVFDGVREHKADGVICGHTHRVEQRLIGPIWYVNDGDWVENCTALVENRDGTLRILQWRLDEDGNDTGTTEIQEAS